MKILKFYLLLFCTLFFFPYPNVMSNEEAPYDVIEKNEIYEIRKYSSRSRNLSKKTRFQVGSDSIPIPFLTTFKIIGNDGFG